MQMKIRFSHIRLATTLAVVFASLGCQSAQKPVAPLMPPPAPAPVHAQPTSERAPIDGGIAATNYPVDPILKAKAAAEIKATHTHLPLMMTDQVAGYI